MKALITFLTTLIVLLAPRAAADLQAKWSTEAVLPGESVYLLLISESPTRDDMRLKRRLTLPNARVDHSFNETSSYIDSSNSRCINVRGIRVIPDKPGTIEPQEVEVQFDSGRSEKVRIPALTVLSTADIQWMSQKIPGGGLQLGGGRVLKEVRYGCLWYVPEKEYYANQPIEARLKLLLPLQPVDFIAPAIPQMQSVDVRVASFGPASLNSQPSVAFADGQDWRSMDYKGEFIPTGKGSQVVQGETIICHRRGIAEMTIPLASLKLSVLPLPPGAPADFNDIVGQFSVKSKSDASYLAMHEPIEVEITVTGDSGLSYLPCPKPDDASAWKLMTPKPTRREIRNAAGELTGVTFSILMRPTAEVRGIPSFGFSYFDPQLQEYRTAASAPIPLPWKQTENAGSASAGQKAAAPPAKEATVVEMTDIYGYMPEGTFSFMALPRWVWLLLYLPGLGIFAALGIGALYRFVSARAAKGSGESALRELAAKENDLDFLRSAGSLIESRIPAASLSPELKDILARRDELAFRPDSEQTRISADERNRILRLLRKAISTTAALALALGLALGTPSSAEESAQAPSATQAPAQAPAQAQANPAAPAAPAVGKEIAAAEITMQEAQKAYEGGQFSRAKDILQQILDGKSAQSEQADPALLYYNIGNCEYRLKRPGYAALAYARALRLDPGFVEAEKNLAFVQRLQGVPIRLRSTGDEVFTFLNRSQLYAATIIVTAAFLFCAALLAVPGRRPRPWRNFLTGLFLVLSVLCVINQVYYATRKTPDYVADPPDNLVYLVRDSRLSNSATESTADSQTLPASTPLQRLAVRGDWSYVEDAAGNRGWIHGRDAEPLNPEGSEARMPLSLRF